MLPLYITFDMTRALALVIGLVSWTTFTWWLKPSYDLGAAHQSMGSGYGA